MANIIDAIENLVQNPVTQLVQTYRANNRANSAGDALEEYVKDLFANSFAMRESVRIIKWTNVFSYLGNANNPPDAMLRGGNDGDAIEIKKIESDNSEIALNSSYPKHKILVTDPMITQSCREAEDWTQRDIIYTVGVVKNSQLKHLCMVYGLDYCASSDVYDRIKQKLTKGINSIPGINFAKTKELGHVNKVDPLGVTYIRLRGMWGIENPWKVFSYIYTRDNTKKFTFMCIINESKWNSLTNSKELELLSKKVIGLDIESVSIKDPDNPANLNRAKLITFEM